MWDNHRLLNSIANALFAIAFLLLAWVGVKLLVESPLFLLRTIRIEGELAHVSRAEVVKALDGRLAGTFFNMDLDAVRVLFETIPWVRRAQVRRVWPDRLEVHMEEHVPIARWGQAGENRMVNAFGEVFSVPHGPAADGGRALTALPQLAGPAGTAPEVLRRYGAFAEALAPLQLRLESVMLSPRYSWQLKLSNGLAVQLGRDWSDKSGEGGEGVEARLARFVAVYPRALASLSPARRLNYVDLRYSNGFALRVPGLKDSAAPPATKSPVQKRPVIQKTERNTV
jgi:cell division protein FtsQ